MNTPFVVAQANTSSSGTGPRSVRTIKINKPQGDQALTVQLGYDQSYKLDLSAIANEKITLVHIGEKLIILFDNKSTVTVEPFFDSMNTPLSNVTVEATGRDFTSNEFASAFPITTDQSVLTAAGVAGAPGTPASGADFHGPAVDPLDVPNPLPLLGQEELPNFVINQLLGAVPGNTTTAPANNPPTIEGQLSGVVEEEALNREVILQPSDSGNGNEDENSASGDDHDTVSNHTVTGQSVDVSLASLVTGGGTLTFSIVNVTADGNAENDFVHDTNGNRVTSFGADVKYVLVNPTLIEGIADGRLVFTLQLIDATNGTFRFTLNDQIDHPTHTVDIGSTSHGALEETLGLDLSSLIGGHDSSNNPIALPNANMFTIGVIDDTPVAQIQTFGEGGLVVDETVPSGDESADPFSYGTPLGVSTQTLVSTGGSNPGADGLGSSTHLSLEVAGGSGADSGLTTTNGTAIHLFLNGAIVEGRVDGSGDVAFALSVNDFGQVTVAQYLALHHPDPSNTNESVDLSGKVNAVVTVTDGDGDVATSSTDIGGSISFRDDAPAADADTNWTQQNGSAATGNVLADQVHNGAPVGTFADHADALGADGFGSISWTGASGGAVAGAHGTLTVDADGNYSYAINPADSAVAALGKSGSLTDTFNYTVTDGDGDAISSTLTVTIFGSDHGVTITNLTPQTDGGDASVNEANLSDGSSPSIPALTQTGTFNVSAPDGLNNLTVDGHPVIAGGIFAPTTFTTGLGNTLSFTGFDAGTGQVTYTYTLLDNETHAPVQGPNDLFENFTVVLTDTDDSSANDTLSVQIVDDVPTAVADTNWVKEGANTIATGNVFQNIDHPGAPSGSFADHADIAGADGIITWTGAAGGSVVGLYGTVTVGGDGSYSYQLDSSNPAVQALANGQVLQDPFTYTITDADGDTSTVVSTITIFGTDNGVTITNLTPQTDGGDASVNEANLSDGSSPSIPALTQTGTFNVSAPDGLNNLTVDGHPVIAGGIFAPTTFTTGLGNTLSFTGFDAGTGQVTYTYTLLDNETHAPVQGPNNLFENFTVVLTDTDGSSANDTLSVQIVDDVPTAHNDTDSVTAGGPLLADGNVITGIGGSDANATDGVADTAGADGIASIAWAGAVGSTVAGAHGTLTVSGLGNYAYTLNSGDSAVQSLSSGQTLTETFTYTITDADGDTSPATLTVTIFGTNDAPTAVADTNWAKEDTNTTASGNVLQNITHAGAPSGSFADHADTDPDATDTLTVSAVTGGSVGVAKAGTYGSVVINANGTYTYTVNNGAANVQSLATGQTVTDTFTYTVSDGHGGTSAANLTVTVFGTNDAPTAVADTNWAKEDTNTTASGNVLQNITHAGAPSGSFADHADTDPDATDTLTVSAVTGGSVGGAVAGTYGSVVINANGTYTYTVNNGAANVQSLATGQTVTDTFTYTVSDGHGGTSAANLTVTVFGTNDAPTAVADTNWAKEDTNTTASGNVLQNITHAGAPSGSFADHADTDPDATDTLTVSAVTGGSVGVAKAGTYGSVVINANGTYTYTVNNGAANVQSLATGQTVTDTFTYTVSDGHGGTSAANLAVTVFGTDDGVTITNLTPQAQGGDASVNEANLSDGSAPNAAALTQTGTFNISTPDGLSSLTVGGHAVITGGVFTATTFATGLGNTLAITGFDAGTGQVTYTYTLLDNETHPVGGGTNSLFENFAVELKDTDGSTANDTLTVNIIDDVPSAHAVTKSLVPAGHDTNIMLVLDVSGSMGDASGLTNLTRLDVLKAAVNELFEQYGDLGNVRVQIVEFSTGASQVGTDWMTIGQAKAAVDALTSGGNTNYDAAVTTAESIFSHSGALTTAGVQNVSYFMSDGVPNLPAGSVGVSASEESTWTTFLNTNHIDSFALGVGSGVTQSALDPLAFNGQTNTNTSSIVVTDLSQLTQTLVGTVAGTGGNILTDGGPLPGSFGADGGFVKSITADGTTYTYDPTGNGSISVSGGANHGSFETTTNTETVTLASGGVLTMDMDNGTYGYTAPANVSSGFTDIVPFVLIDNDGDTAGNSLTIVVSTQDHHPIVRDDHVITNAPAVSGADQIVIPDYALLFNDSDPESQTITITGVSGAVDGSVAHAGGNVTFTEESSGANDGGSFTYTGATTSPAASDTADVAVDRSQTGTTLTGTGLGEILMGRDGANNVINGNEGNDVLIAGNGNDTLNGGTGNDLMVGGAGNDTYIVDSAGDQVVENASGGTDVVQASVSYTLSANVENLTLTGSADINGTGNSLDNVITGNSGANILDGGAGNDTITGAAGKDTMTGGSGNDTFVFNATSESGNTSATADVITDFVHGQDIIDVSAIDANTSSGGNQAFTFNGVTPTAHGIWYTESGGNTIISMDTNGSTGSAEMVIVLTGINKNLSAADFHL